jgi:RNA polymerase sigma factor (sigma-70 family)
MENTHCVWIKGEAVYVSEEIFRTYMQSVWRAENRKKASAVREISYELMCEKDFDGQACANTKSVEDIIADKLLIEEMYKALDNLDGKDRVLIEALFFCGKTERDLSCETGVPQSTINYRKNRILKELRKKLNNF